MNSNDFYPFPLQNKSEPTPDTDMLARLKSELRQQLERPLDEHEIIQQYTGVAQSIRSIPYARKLSDLDYDANKQPNNQWHLLTVSRKTDPFTSKTAGGTTNQLIDQIIDQMFDGEGVDLVCADGGDGIAIPNHPEWMSGKYPGVNRFVKYNWASTSPFVAIPFNPVKCNNNLSTNNGKIYVDVDFSTKLLFGDSSWNELYGRKVTVMSGPGAGQSRRISSVDSIARTCTTNPWDVIHVGSAQATTNNTITLASSASSTNGFYNNHTVHIDSGTGTGQSYLIVGYVGATKVATIDSTWDTLPSAGATYHIANVPTSASNMVIEPFSVNMDTYYDVYNNGEHGTGTMGLAGGKTYGFAKESTLYTIGSHGPTELVDGINGNFSFSGSSIITSNATVVSRLSYLQPGDFIEISGATPSGNNGSFVVHSNTLVDGTRTVVVVDRPTIVSSSTFVAGSSTNTTSIKHARCLWGLEQILDMVTGFHMSKSNGRPTVLCMNVLQNSPISSDNIINTKIGVIGGRYVNLDLTSSAGRTQASDLYNIPYRDTQATGGSAYVSSIEAALTRATKAGVIVTQAAGNYDHRIVSDDDPTFNDYCITSTTKYISDISIVSATSNTVTLQSAPGYIVDDVIRVTTGTGVGQHRYVASFDESTGLATIAPNWDIIPEAGSKCDGYFSSKRYFNRGVTSSAPAVTTVGAVQQSYINGLETRADYSCVGPRIDVFVPADTAITSAVDPTTRPLWNGVSVSTNQMPHPDDVNFRVGSFSGTSAANPLAAGVAACIAQARPWIDSGSIRATMHDIASRGRLYDNPSFADPGSLGGADNRFLWYPFQHISSDQ